MTDYKTILESFETEIEIKKSKFLNFVFPVENEVEVESILVALRKKHYKATHICFAYVLHTDPKRQKSSDDGEPPGTAGKPILEVINQRKLKNTLVIVVRYFGGIKLGTGGLVRAYGGGAVDVLNKVKIIEKKMINQIKVVIDYSLYGGLINQLTEINHAPVNEKFAEKVTLNFEIPIAESDDFIKWLNDQTSANIEISQEGQKIVAIKEP